MKPLTLGQAAKATGRAKGTISNAIKKGRLSGSKNEFGEYEIDAAELLRVFGEQVKLNDKQNDMDSVPQGKNPDITTTMAIDLGKAQAEKQALEAQITALNQLLAKSEQSLERERENSDEWRKQAQTLALASPEQDNHLSFWQRMFGKR